MKKIIFSENSSVEILTVEEMKRLQGGDKTSVPGATSNCTGKCVGWPEGQPHKNSGPSGMVCSSTYEGARNAVGNNGHVECNTKIACTYCWPD